MPIACGVPACTADAELVGRASGRARLGQAPRAGVVAPALGTEHCDYGMLLFQMSRYSIHVPPTFFHTAM